MISVKEMIGLIVMVKEFQIRSFFWSMYQTNDARAMVMREMSDDLYGAIARLIEGYQGRFRKRIDFSGVDFRNVRYSDELFDMLLKRLDPITELTVDAGLWSEVVTLLYRYRGRLNRTGKV